MFIVGVVTHLHFVVVQSDTTPPLPLLHCDVRLATAARAGGLLRAAFSLCGFIRCHNAHLVEDLLRWEGVPHCQVHG